MTALGQYIASRGELFTIENFTHNGAVAYALISQSGPQAIFAPSFLSGKAEPLTNQQELQSALSSYYLSRGFDAQALRKLESVHSGFLGIKGSSKSGETECYRLMGLEGRPCNGDYEKCKAYCIGTPFCNNFAYGGTLGEFVYVMLEFENLTRNLDAAYENESIAYAALANSTSKDTVAAYLLSIGGVNRAATKVSSSKLFEGYSFCFTPEYSLPTITTLQLSAQNAYRQSLPFLEINGTARDISNRTIEGISRKLRFDAALEAAQAAGKKRNESGNQSNATLYGNGAPNQTWAQPTLPAPGPSQPVPSGTLAIIAAAVALVALAVASYMVKMRNKSSRKKPEASEKAEKDIRRGKR